MFVPPFNRFDASQYDLLAERFDVVCGGPESVAMLGYHRTPLWRGQAVYMPAYEPFYGRAAAVTEAVDRAVAAQAALWIPVVLHLSWEADSDWADLKRLALRLREPRDGVGRVRANSPSSSMSMPSSSRRIGSSETGRKPRSASKGSISLSPGWPS